MSFLINPYAFLAAGGDYESIATVTVGSGGASSIEFTSIPGTYQHLQVRGILKTDRASTGDTANVTINSDTGSNYAYHWIVGTGSAASAAAASSDAQITTNSLAGDSSATNIWAGLVLDILDYASTTKNTTVRSTCGNDRNGAGAISLGSGLWVSTSAVTSIKFAPGFGSNFKEHSTLALYGIKAP